MRINVHILLIGSMRDAIIALYDAKISMWALRACVCIGVEAFEI